MYTHAWVGGLVGGWMVLLVYSCCIAVTLTCTADVHMYTPTVRPTSLFLNVNGRQKRELRSPSLFFFFSAVRLLLCTCCARHCIHTGGRVGVLVHYRPH